MANLEASVETQHYEETQLEETQPLEDTQFETRVEGQADSPGKVEQKMAEVASSLENLQNKWLGASGDPANPVANGVEQLERINAQLESIQGNTRTAATKIGNVELRQSHGSSSHDPQACIRHSASYAKGESSHISDETIKNLAVIEQTQEPAKGASYGKIFLAKDYRRSENVATVCQKRLQDSCGCISPARKQGSPRDP